MECFKIIVIGLLFSVSAFSQTDTLEYKEVGIGFNFINNFVPTDNEIGEESPFQFYINTWKGTKVNRVALGFDFDGSVERSNDDERKIFTNSVSALFRLGRGKMKNISDKIKFIGGSDFLLGFDYKSLNVNDDDNPQIDNKRVTKFYQLGGGFFGGVQFEITPKLSLYTEMSYMILLDYTTNAIEFRSTSIEDSKDSEFNYGTRYSAPSYLVLFYRFN